MRLEVRTEHAERLVRVDAAVLRPRDRLGALERKTRGVREQMPHGRAGRTGGLVEVDDALLRRDQRGQGGNGLRHRGEPHGAGRFPANVNVPGRIDDTGSGELDRPVVDLAESLHARRY